MFVDIEEIMVDNEIVYVLEGIIFFELVINGFDVVVFFDGWFFGMDNYIF